MPRPNERSSKMNNTDITTLEFHGEPVATIIDGNGNILFCAKHVAKALGYTNTNDAIKRHCKGVVKRYPLQTSGGIQETIFITEGDVYRLIASSKLPAAIEFEHWLFDEVVPSIRRHGGYIAGQEDMSPEQMTLAAMRWLESKVAEQQAQLEAQKPKVLFSDAVSASDGTCLVGELAKMITQAGRTIGQNRLFQLLRDDGYLGKTGQNRNVPLQRYVEQGLFKVKETAVTHADGHVSLNRTTKVTGKGQTYFLNKYAHTNMHNKLGE